MNSKFGVVTAGHCYLRQSAGSSDTVNESGIEDEIFSGWAVKAISEEENGWIEIETHYGYRGYVCSSEIKWIDREELLARQNKTRFWHMNAPEADLLNLPKVQGLPKELILKNAIVELLEVKTEEEGWSLIRTAAGREGYVHNTYLVERSDDDGYLLTKQPREEYFCKCYSIADEQAFRQGIANRAMEYLSTQYRWGGKSSQGIDCSGLAFMSYLKNGVLIYRDANIVEGYPIKEISKEMMKQGDLIFFPGHVAIYLGEDRFIHSTAYAKTPCVTINSLNPEHEDYREDLATNITACGSIF